MDYIAVCRSYYEAASLPITVLKNEKAVYSALGEYLGIQPPKTWALFPLEQNPCFCGESQDILYGRLRVEGTEYEVILGPVFGIPVNDGLLRQLWRELLLPAALRERLAEFVYPISAIGRTQFGRHMAFLHRLFNGQEIDPALLYGAEPAQKNVTAYNEKMIAMFENGQANTAALDAAVLRVLTAKFRMGIFEHPYALEGEELGQVFSHPEDRESSLRSAEESLVLLKNDGILPMKKIRKLAVIGPHADHANKFFGGYTHLCMAESTYAVASSIAGVDGVEGASDIPEEYAQSDDPAVQRMIAEYKEKLAGVKFVPGTHV